MAERQEQHDLHFTTRTSNKGQEEHYQDAIERVEWENEKLEEDLKNEILFTADLEKDIISLQMQIEKEKADYEARKIELEQQTEDKAAELQTNSAFLKELKSLAKVFEQKSGNYEKLLAFLESLVKSEEDFTMNLDQFISKSLQGEVLSSLLSEPKTTSIIKAKLKHRSLLTDFKNEYAELMAKEKMIAKRMTPSVS